MKARALWFLSLSLIVSAIVLHVGALGVAGRHVEYFNKSMNPTEPHREEMKAEAAHYRQKSNRLVIFGWSAAGISMACLFGSYRKDEPAPRSVVITLAAMYVLLQFTVI